MKMYRASFLCVWHVSAPFNEVVIPPVLVSGIFAEGQLAVDSQIYAGPLYLIPLVSMSAIFLCQYISHRIIHNILVLFRIANL